MLKISIQFLRLGLYITSIIPLSAQEKTITHQNSLQSILDKYYALHTQLFQAGSTISEIDQAFALFTADFTYTHTRFDSQYTRESLYKSAFWNLEQGNYDGRIVGYKIENTILGVNAATVQKRFLEKKNDVVVKSELQMTLFEFKNGKIPRIIEYW
ncbi:nuclear transport factor 2 family protein [Marivirga arenosa]|uniref:Nuclear transport factor 2 family protein n=1 Tax=Marivirga arenosa TaxID=3059076 RepID=A0AA51ZY57_9BACT|nr:nuclear transport factor 2 family protein [Marivirga sp. BKB1-2]WNB18865.1 nuclear transport factor 2 family protein [Marivirga sp. BKB1-2]